MVCIYCGGKTQVVNSRGAAKKPAVWRRRQCLECKAIVTTREQIDLSEAIRVKYSDGRLEPFQRDKLFVSVLNSLSHRKTATEDAGALTETIVERLFMQVSGGMIAVFTISSTTLETVSRFDQAGGVYYKAHYLSRSTFG